MSSLLLHQLLAVKKSRYPRNYGRISDVHQICQKADQFSGMSRVYSPLKEDGEMFPPEAKRIQQTLRGTIGDSKGVLDEAQELYAENWQDQLSLDRTNQTAKANVVVGGTPILENVPVSFLLFLEKQLQDVKTFFEKLPVLDPNEEWTRDAAKDCWVTRPTPTQKTKKVPKTLVKAEATDKHPAQVEVFHEDVTIGTWNLTKFSSAISAAEKREMLRRVTTLLTAVKIAREQANSISVESGLDARSLVDYLFQ